MAPQRQELRSVLNVRSGLLERIASFVCSPPDSFTGVLQEAKLRLLDAVGCAIFGARLPHSRALVSAFGAESTSCTRDIGCRLIGVDSAAPHPTMAALMNGALVSSFELDDVGSYLHPGAAIVPATLSCASMTDTRRAGRRLLEAIAVGYEVAVRISEAAGFAPEGIIGWHTPGFHGAIGAAAATARMLELDVDQTLNSLAIAADLAGGGLMHSRFGSDVKRSHTGRAAQTGLQASLMARAGLTGVHDVLENSRWGYLRALTYLGEGSRVDDSRIHAISKGLGQTYRGFDAIAYKAYPVTAKGIGIIDNIRSLRNQAGFSLSDLHTVDIGLSRMGSGQPANAEPASELRHVNFSYPYATAIALTSDAEPITRSPEVLWSWINGIHNPAVSALQSLVTVSWASEIDEENPYSMDSVVTLILGNETLSSRVRYGDSTNHHAVSFGEMTAADVVAKFINLTTDSIGSTRADDIVRIVEVLDQAETIDELLFALSLHL